MRVHVIGFTQEELPTLHESFTEAGLRLSAWSIPDQLLSQWATQTVDLVLITHLCSQVARFLQALRQFAATPVVALVETQEEAALLALYAASASCVLTPPYRPRLLAAQLKALADQRHPVLPAPLSSPSSAVVQVDPDRRTVQLAPGTPVHLTRREYQLFDLLFTHQGQTLPYDQLITAIWGYSGIGAERALYNLIYTLRHKLEPAPETPRYLRTIAGCGYQFAQTATYEP